MPSTRRKTGYGEFLKRRDHTFFSTIRKISSTFLCQRHQNSNICLVTRTYFYLYAPTPSNVSTITNPHFNMSSNTKAFFPPFLFRPSQELNGLPEQTTDIKDDHHLCAAIVNIQGLVHIYTCVHSLIFLLLTVTA